MKAALYSASQLEMAIVGYFFLSHKMHELPGMKQKSLVVTRVSNQSPKKHLNLATMIPPWDKTTQDA